MNPPKSKTVARTCGHKRSGPRLAHALLQGVVAVMDGAAGERRLAHAAARAVGVAAQAVRNHIAGCVVADQSGPRVTLNAREPVAVLAHPVREGLCANSPLVAIADVVVPIAVGSPALNRISEPVQPVVRVALVQARGTRMGVARDAGGIVVGKRSLHAGRGARARRIPQGVTGKPTQAVEAALVSDAVAPYPGSRLVRAGVREAAQDWDCTLPCPFRCRSRRRDSV